MKRALIGVLMIMMAAVPVLSCQKPQKEIERPEKIVSLRQVKYDSTTIAKITQLWENYYSAYLRKTHMQTGCTPEDMRISLTITRWSRKGWRNIPPTLS